MKLKLGHINPKYFHVSKLVPSPAPFRAFFTLLKTFAHLNFPFGVSFTRAAAATQTIQILPGTKSWKTSI